jgi:hypothetical protein
MSILHISYSELTIQGLKRGLRGLVDYKYYSDTQTSATKLRRELSLKPFWLIASK